MHFLCSTFLPFTCLHCSLLFMSPTILPDFFFLPFSAVIWRASFDFFHFATYWHATYEVSVQDFYAAFIDSNKSCFL